MLATAGLGDITIAVVIMGGLIIITGMILRAAGRGWDRICQCGHPVTEHGRYCSKCSCLRGSFAARVASHAPDKEG